MHPTYFTIVTKTIGIVVVDEHAGIPHYVVIREKTDFRVLVDVSDALSGQLLL